MSVIVTPLVDKVPLAAGLKVNVVNVPAAGVVPPIIALSIVPSLRSILAIATLPVPLADKIISELDSTVCILLSNNLMLESTVKLVILTVPVPPGVILISAFELEPTILSLKDKLSIETVPVSVVLPVVVNDASAVSYTHLTLPTKA